MIQLTTILLFLFPTLAFSKVKCRPLLKINDGKAFFGKLGKMEVYSKNFNAQFILMGLGQLNESKCSGIKKRKKFKTLCFAGGEIWKNNTSLAVKDNKVIIDTDPLTGSFFIANKDKNPAVFEIKTKEDGFITTSNVNCVIR